MGQLNGIVIGCRDAERMSEFWSQALEGYEVDRQEWGISMKSATQPLIYFEVVEDAKAVEPRLHLNMRAAAREAEVARLVGLGATEVETMQAGTDYAWTNMQDVEGNAFCVSQGASVTAA
jgi:hypothetical protein